MLRHIVLVTFKPEATSEERAALRAAVEGFRDSVPEVRALECGDNVGKGPNHHDFAVVADFDDMAAFRRYIESDAHKAYVAGPAKAVARLAAIQHEI
ncbi:Dabb family protein [Tropicimonas sediminicola]|uniref:Stress responsive A/B Barrel Domain n=1 Tax=Tropicimonas sediminicola TaxID=1031541 RepID=A0A239HAP1_9RHOB|nr:Dabb family protein [Tropicimonas sediminicola]SNS78479.1 Stress responsive A/B Barrel Domain [Tropicimonas sediminicola]